MSLWDLFINHKGLPIHKWAHYFPAYERHFGRFVDEQVTFIEIGCGHGGSAQMWKEYFGPRATIIGVDILEQAEAFEEEQIHVRIGDQADPDFVASLIDEFGAPDAVLDDGSHRMKDVCATFEFLYPRVAGNGVYMVEDMHTAYWPRFGGGLGRSGTFVERAKALVDELNAHHVRGGALQPTAFTDTTASMHFYDSIIAFERGVIGERHSVQVRDGAARVKLRVRDPGERHQPRTVGRSEPRSANNG